MLTFYRNAFTLPGFKPQQPDWTEIDETELVEMLPFEAMEMIAKENVAIIIPTDLPPPAGCGGLSWRSAAAGITQIEEAEKVLLAFSKIGFKKFVDEVTAGTQSTTYRNHVITSSVVHEMVHLKQLRDGRILEHPDGSVTWEGSHWTMEDCETVGYIDLPWEREAFNAQFKYISQGHAVVEAQLWTTLRENAVKAGLAM